jgi:hypothetical protein
MSGRMFRITPDQPAKGGRLRISHLSGDFFDGQARGLKQISCSLNSDPLNELNR